MIQKVYMSADTAQMKGDRCAFDTFKKQEAIMAKCNKDDSPASSRRYCVDVMWALQEAGVKTGDQLKYTELNGNPKNKKTSLITILCWRRKMRDYLFDMPEIQ